MISNIYEAIGTLVTSTLSDYERVAYSYDNTQIGDAFKEKAFTVGVEPGDNTERLINCKGSFNRSFKLILFNKRIIRRQNFQDVIDLEKLFLTDVDTLFVAAEKEPQLFGTCANFKMVGDGGVVTNEDDTLNSMKIEIVFEAEYFLKI